jgi:hypothetical protein
MLVLIDGDTLRAAIGSENEAVSVWATTTIQTGLGAATLVDPVAFEA